MSQALLQHVSGAAVKGELPDLRPGHVVRVHQKIKEGEKERVQIFEGLVMSLNAGAKADKTFTVRKVVEGVGVEKVYPLYSPLIEKIEIVKQGKVRRSKLYYMRDLAGKSTRLQDEELSEEDKKFLKGAKKKVEKVEAPVVEEAVVAEEAPVQDEPVVEEATATEAAVEAVENAPVEENKEEGAAETPAEEK
jgi:large subunit ribosomal protein L19